MVGCRVCHSGRQEMPERERVEASSRIVDRAHRSAVGATALGGHLPDVRSPCDEQEEAGLVTMASNRLQIILIVVAASIGILAIATGAQWTALAMAFLILGQVITLRRRYRVTSTAPD